MTNPIKKFINAPVALKASIVYLICSILQKSLSFITMPLFTSILTKSEYGLYTVYTSWSSLFSIIITLNLAYGSFGNAMLKYENKREEYVSSIQGITLSFAMLCLCIYLPFNSFFNKLTNLPTSLMCLMIVEIVATFGFECWLGMQRYKFKYISVALVTILMAVLSPTLAYILIKNSSNKGEARILGYVIVTIVFGGCIFVYNIVKGRTFFSRKYWGYAFRFNLPLLAYYLSQVIFNQSDKIMIEKICDDGLSYAAVYGVGYQIALILTFVLNALNNAYVPWLYNEIKDGDYKKNRKISTLMTILMCTLVGGVVWIAPEVIKVLAGSEYIDAIYVIPPVSISLILLLFSQFAINIEFYYAEKWKLVIASIGAALLNVVLNLWLIPIFGFIAAAYTTLASYVVFAVCNYFSVFRKIKKNGKLYGIYNVLLLLIIFAAFCALVYVGVLLYEYPIARYSSIGAVILLLLCFSPTLYKKYKEFKAKSKQDNNESLTLNSDNNENDDLELNGDSIDEF